MNDDEIVQANYMQSEVLRLEHKNEELTQAYYVALFVNVLLAGAFAVLWVFTHG